MVTFLHKMIEMENVYKVKYITLSLHKIFYMFRMSERVIEFYYLDPFTIKVKSSYHHSFSKLLLLLSIGREEIYMKSLT